MPTQKKKWNVIHKELKTKSGRTFFKYEEQNLCKFLGKIIKVIKGRFVGDFLSPIDTKINSGYVYSIPPNKQSTTRILKFNFNQIVKKVQKPVTQPRGTYLFDVALRELNS